MAPTTTKNWVITGTDKDFDGLELQDAQIPKLSENEILVLSSVRWQRMTRWFVPQVEIDAVSLNYRDLIIPKVPCPEGQIFASSSLIHFMQGLYPMPASFPRIPGSDACGTVVSTGTKVSRFSTGQKVCTLFHQGHIAGPITPAIAGTGLGGALDGTLRQYAVFPENGLVLAPATLNPIEASTLSCAPLTAWNALYGLTDRALRPGDVVLTQGTGGVSIAALQFAIAAGATVIATTSSDAKAKKLKELGAHHIINYKDTPNWGEEAKKLTPGGEGWAVILMNWRALGLPRHDCWHSQ
jgi:NADPH:quinone reductase-like Zn-dependent oxidoreductase